MSDEIHAAMGVVGVERAFGFLKQTDWAARAAAERRIKRKVQKILNTYLEKAVTAVEQGEQFDYAGMAKELQAAIQPELSAMVVDTALGVSVDVGIGFDPTIINTHALGWARRYTEGLIRGLTETTRRQIDEVITSFVQTPGMTQGDLEKLLKPAFGPVRAEMIATTEVTRAYSAATNEIQTLVNQTGLQMMRVWQTQNDELVCPICGPLNGRPESDPLWAPYPDGPPAHPRCVLPGNVVSVPGLVAGAKSFYVGRAIEIRTAGGRVLTVTQNHPILTRQGWGAAHLLCEGMNIVVCTQPERIASSIYPDYDGMPAAIEKVFCALEMSEAMFRSRVPASAEGLHGDGRDVYGNVNIVSPNRFLLGDIEARLAELVGKGCFDGDSVHGSAFEGDSAITFLSPGDNPTTGSRMSSGDLIAAALWGHPRPLEGFGFGLSTARHTGFTQKTGDDITVDTNLAREFILRFASLIALDKISSIRQFDFSGHVYDLQSGIYGLYTVNGVLSSNCRCGTALTARPVEDIQAEAEELAREREEMLRELENA